MYIQLTLLFILTLIVLSIIREIIFRRSAYYKMTGNGYFEIISDAGKYGEYLTYQQLKTYEADGGKFLFNCYLPKGDGTTTEIDVILIHSTGIFVIESKNYSGWIFGSEKAKTWTQTLRNGRGRAKKEHFYNPIMQNNTHIKHLKKIVGMHVPVYSVIAFSERCVLKDVTVESADIKVVNRQHVGTAVKYLGNQSIQALSKMDVERIYEMLYPYTQTTEYEKLQHIMNVNTIKRDGKIVPITKQKDAEKVIEAETVSVPKTETSASDQKEEESTKKQDSKRICPRCSAELVLRTAKKGEHAREQFYGCSRFPKCRYKESV